MSVIGIQAPKKSGLGPVILLILNGFCLGQPQGKAGWEDVAKEFLQESGFEWETHHSGEGCEPVAEPVVYTTRGSRVVQRVEWDPDGTGPAKEIRVPIRAVFELKPEDSRFLCSSSTCDSHTEHRCSYEHLPAIRIYLQRRYTRDARYSDLTLDPAFEGPRELPGNLDHFFQEGFRWGWSLLTKRRKLAEDVTFGSWSVAGAERWSVDLCGCGGSKLALLEKPGLWVLKGDESKLPAGTPWPAPPQAFCAGPSVVLPSLSLAVGTASHELTTGSVRYRARVDLEYDDDVGEVFAGFGQGDTINPKHPARGSFKIYKIQEFRYVARQTLNQVYLGTTRCAPKWVTDPSARQHSTHEGYHAECDQTHLPATIEIARTWTIESKHRVHVPVGCYIRERGEKVGGKFTVDETVDWEYGLVYGTEGPTLSGSRDDCEGDGGDGRANGGSQSGGTVEHH